MLERSFVMIPGIGLGRERRLWELGITDFDAFIDAEWLPGISRNRLHDFHRGAEEARRRVRLGDVRWICKALPKREIWRILAMRDKRIAALDIECARRGNTWTPVVVSVCLKGKECVTLIRGENLYWDKLSRLLDETDILLTYNGSSYDLPVLARHGFRVDRCVHLDLARFSRMLGLTGGLKCLEKRIGITRPRELEYSTESQASYLWDLWEKKGNKRAIDLLVEYNRQDAESLIPLADIMYRMLRANRLKGVEGHAETRGAG